MGGCLQGFVGGFVGYLWEDLWELGGSCVGGRLFVLKQRSALGIALACLRKSPHHDK